MSGEAKGGLRGRPREAVLLGFAAGVLLLHVDLAGFEVEPYGTVSIDGDEVELFSPVGGSPLLIFGVAALLLVGQWRTLVASMGQPALYGFAIPALVFAIALGSWAHYVEAHELLIPALIAWWLGGAAWLGGAPALRAVAVPSLFLVFAYPIPAAIVNSVVWPLQISAAQSADLVLRTMGFASERFGDIVVLDGHSFMVIETCSGMRMIETLVMASALYAVLFYRRPSQVAVLLLAAPILGYAVNLLRVLSIIFNPYSEWSAVHETQGVVMLVMGIVVIAGLDQALQRRERRLGLAPTPRPPLPEPREDWGARRAAVLASVLLITTAVQFTLEPWPAPKRARIDAFDIPNTIDGAKARGRKLDRQFYGSVGISRWLHREYDYRGEPVAVQILVDDRLERSGSLLSPKTAIPGGGLIALKRETVVLDGGRHVDRVLYTGRDRRELVYHWTEGIAGTFEEWLRDGLALDRGPLRREGVAMAVRLSTPIREAPNALEEADQRLRGFADEIRVSRAREESAAKPPRDGTS